ncbi:MAG: heterodisulfide reductase-related iron-sulfur binding cluster [Candidatus Aminicenantes bacterium]|nr:heterodisulfide reductase-related iron-sulfur binding cluster [Candidatus Aminicenantes bacterium]
MKKTIFAPGCALILYKPYLVERIHQFLDIHYGTRERLLTCCRRTPQIAPGTQVINICPGCDRRYRENYDNPSTISLWELLSESETFVFPDYQSQKMTIIDACPTRDQDRIHRAVRALAERMNISLVEPARTKRKSTCCGDTFFGALPTEQVIDQMKAKAAEMPVDQVLVYCVSCSKSMFIGGKQPRYLVDLLFAEETVPKTYDPDRWHEELDEFIANHNNYEVIFF